MAALEILKHPAADRLAANVSGEDWGSIALAGVSFTLALLSFLIGSVGVLFAGRKREWLHRRLMGESIRQFHFQMLIFRLPQILASLKDDATKTAFLSQRTLWLESFKARFAGHLDAIFAAIIQEENKAEPWLHDRAKPGERAKVPESKELDPLFEAYRELRFEHQLGYANYRLQDDHRLISSMPRRQLAVLSQAVFIWTILLVALHAGYLLGALVPVLTLFHSAGAIVAIIWCALAALATRAIEQGLQPEREIERYQQYRSGIRAILERYDEAPSQNAKIEVMREMERLAFDEMRNFLITNERSRFVM
jgi:membrane protein implicated in regulation of membrane protease activity